MGILKNIKTKISTKDEKVSPKKVETKAKKKSKEKIEEKQVSAVIIRPVLTEKSTKLVEQKKYVFEVDQNANKIQVAKAIKQTYGVEPKSVQMMNFRGKSMRFGRYQGQRKGWKKAIVTLNSKDSIEIFEGV